MKKILILLAALVAIAAHARDVKYYDAASLPLLGKAISEDASAKHYTRLPDSLASLISRRRLPELGTNTAGMAVRFATESPIVRVTWKSPWKFEMSLQSPTGTRGLDLYVLDDDGVTWTFANSGRPMLDTDHNLCTIMDHMKPRMREYMLYLSLYDGVDSLMIGVDSAYSVLPPLNPALPATDRPIVMYGTSLLQGAGATRPGMCHSNILQRWLNREVINLGFGGHGQLDLPVAQVIAAVQNPSMIVLDFVPNCSPEQIDTLMIPFYDIIRTAHPDVPILFVEGPQFTTARHNKAIRTEYEQKNAHFRQQYKLLKKRGEKNILYLDNSKIVDHSLEATVDEVHYTDPQYLHYARLLLPIIRKHMK